LENDHQMKLRENENLNKNVEALNSTIESIKNEGSQYEE